MPSYTTLASVRRHGRFASDAIADDADLAEKILDCSQMIEDWFGQNFDVRTETHNFNGEVGSATLDLDLYPLLSVTALTNADGTTVAAANYALLPLSSYPKDRLRLAQGNYWNMPTVTNWTWPIPVDYSVDAIGVVGEWGYVRAYPTNCWRRVTAKVNATMSSSTTSLTVDAAALLDVGNVIRIGGSGGEQLRIDGPVIATSTVLVYTVERAYNGTTAASHAVNDAIDVFKVERLIETATKECVLAVYEGEQSKGGKSMVAGAFGSVTMEDVPMKVREKMQAPWWNFKRGAYLGTGR